MPEKEKEKIEVLKFCCKCKFYKQPQCFVNTERPKFTARKKTCSKWEAKK